MSGYKEPTLAERQSLSSKAKKVALEKFRENARDPAFAKRQVDRAARQAQQTNARHTRNVQKAAKKARDVELAEQTARLAVEQTARDLENQRTTEISQEADRKAARDARYAARKARNKR